MSKGSRSEGRAARKARRVLGLALVAGVASITVGLAQAWPPAAWIFAGIVAAAAAVLLDRARPRP